MRESNNFDLSEYVVLITGGTKGIGAGIARLYLEAGARVVVCGRQKPEQPIKSGERQADFYSLDLRDDKALSELFAYLEEHYGRLDVVVNNAGGSPAADAAEASPRFSEAIIRLNLLVPLNVAQLANRLMQKQEKGGVIIFVGSISAHRASPCTAAYGAAKAGVLSLVKSLAVEWAPRVRVCSISPGLIQTEQSHLHFGDETGIAAIARTIPAGRLGRPDDVANACLFASSGMAEYWSGSDLLIHGGGEKPAFLEQSNADQP